MHKIFFAFTTAILSICCSGLFAQEQDIFVLTNAQPIDSSRYDGIDGSPYLLKHWPLGVAYTLNGEKLENMKVNLNGESGEMEARQGGHFLEIDQSSYLRVEIHAVDNADIFPEDMGEKIVFQQKLHKQFKNRWVILAYQGKDLSLLREFSAVVSTKTFEDVGKTVEKKRFIRKNKYYLLQQGELTPLKLQKKKLLSALDHKSDMERFLKQNKINLKKQEDLVKVFAYYEGLGE